MIIKAAKEFKEKVKIGDDQAKIECETKDLLATRSSKNIRSHKISLIQVSKYVSMQVDDNELRRLILYL